MKPRIDERRVAPKVIEAMTALQQAVESLGIEPRLLDFIKVRASQVNGCAFCISMHTHDAKERGETDQRLHLLPVWREVPSFFTDQERALLAWTEAVTLVSRDHVPDDVYEQAHAQFDDAQLASITLAIVAINGWNRFSISFRKTPKPLEESK